MQDGAPTLQALRRAALACRGCLRPMEGGGEAGLCARCWEGLLPLPGPRCARCALIHDFDRECRDPSAWARGDALWDYRGGRPALGALLVPGIKAGEGGWRTALLDRTRTRPLPDWVEGVDAVVPAPTLFLRRLMRGFDLAADWAGILGQRSGKPVLRALAKHWRSRAQSGRPESERRRLPRKSILLRSGKTVEGMSLLLADDVWTTGATLHRCAQVLLQAGAREVSVLALFRAT